MISHITVGLFLFGINLRSTGILLSLLLMLIPSSACLSSAFRRTTAPSSSTTPLLPSLLVAVSCFAPRAPIPPHRTARLNGCYAHSTTWCAPSCFMLLCLPPTGWRHWRPPFSCSTGGPPHPSVTVYHIISCIALCQTIPLFEFLAACATQTLVPRHLTNWLHALLLACSFVIPSPKRATAALISRPDA